MENKILIKKKDYLNFQAGWYRGIISSLHFCSGRIFYIYRKNKNIKHLRAKFFKKCPRLEKNVHLRTVHNWTKMCDSEMSQIGHGIGGRKNERVQNT